MVCERPWVRVPVVPSVLSSRVTFDGSVWVHARAATASSKGTVSSVRAWFRADSETTLIMQGENCHRSTVWLGSPVVRVLARYARGSGFVSQSGLVFFLSCDIW